MPLQTLHSARKPFSFNELTCNMRVAQCCTGGARRCTKSAGGAFLRAPHAGSAYRALWLPSQIGGFAVCLQQHR